MNFCLKNRWLTLSVLFFLITSIFIIHGYGVYWSDVPLYHEVAFYAVKGGFRAYHDFWFPYPPLTLPLLYLPIYGSSEIVRYRTFFQYEMFIFNCTAVTYLILFLKNRCSCTQAGVAGAVTLYSIFNLLTGHLIYDRIDIVTASLFIASLYHFTAEKKRVFNNFLSYMLYLGGSLIKLLPLLWWPVYTISECFRENSEKPEDKRSVPGLKITQNQLKRAIIPFAAIVLPFIVIMVTYNIITFNYEKGRGMSTFMAEHGKRGIQIESTWATPMMLSNAYSRSKNRPVPFPVTTNFGAQHFEVKYINKIYLTASKYSGFIALAAIYIIFFLYFSHRKESRKAVSDPIFLLTFLSFVILFIISTQRVLSSQYLIWSIPSLSLLVFAGKKIDKTLLFLSLMIYILSFTGFDLGYEKLIKFDPAITVAVACRNILLMLTTGYLFFRLTVRVAIHSNDSLVKSEL
jgi:hypothetical protein